MWAETLADCPDGKSHIACCRFHGRSPFCRCFRRGLLSKRCRWHSHIKFRFPDLPQDLPTPHRHRNPETQLSGGLRSEARIAARCETSENVRSPTAALRACAWLTSVE